MVKLAPLEKSCYRRLAINVWPKQHFFLPETVSFREKNFFVFTFPNDVGLWVTISFAQQCRRLSFFDTDICFHHVHHDWGTSHLQIDFFCDGFRHIDIDLTFVFASIGCSKFFNLNLDINSVAWNPIWWIKYQIANLRVNCMCLLPHRRLCGFGGWRILRHFPMSTFAHL